MKTALGIVILISFLPAIAPSKDLPKNSSAAKTAMNTTIAKNDFSVATLSVPTGTISPRSELSVELKNTGKEVLSLIEPNGTPPIKMELAGSNEVKASRPPAEKGDFEGIFSVGSARFVRLATGESRTWILKLDQYSVLEDGNYVINLSIDVSTIERVKGKEPRGISHKIQFSKIPISFKK